MLHTLKKVDAKVLREIIEEKKIRKIEEVFLLFSLGSQFDHLIKQALEKNGVFCLVADPASVTSRDVKKVNPLGIILSGGPASVYDTPPPFDEKIFDLDIPILGICLGFQLWAKHCGIEVRPAEKREFGTHKLKLKSKNSDLFFNCPMEFQVLESHGDRIEINNKLRVLGSTENAPVSAANLNNFYGVQFHPEVADTENGMQIFENFCFKICGAEDKFPAEKIAERKVEELRKKISEKKTLLLLSGGADSSTVAYLLKAAYGGKKGMLRGIYIKGIDRPDDEAYVLKYFKNKKWIDLKIVDATDDFLQALAGKITMPEKRIGMREIYKSIAEKEVRIFKAHFIAQGTLYTDISESGGGYDCNAKKAQIKLHHNVNLGFTLPEITPLDDCVKDGGRNIGRTIGVPEELLIRHPFPGPGLVVRIEGEVTREKLSIARKADKIYIEELRKWKLYNLVWQAGAVVTQSATTCTKGDDAASGILIALWAVWSVNGFTAQAAELPFDFLKHVDRRMTNEIREVGATLYRLTGKPPSTIEMG